MNAKVAGCVVLYNPSNLVLSNIHSYYPHLDFLISIDNSEHKNSEFERACKQQFPDIYYKRQGGNTGIAIALNYACQVCIEKGYDWLLTMDQDSCFEENDLQHMINHISRIEAEFGKVGIITPYHIVSRELVNQSDTMFTKRNIAMTSGNLLRLSAIKQCGFFDENLFIDFVDYEYTLRLRQNGFAIIQDNTIHMKHSLGDFSVKRFLGIKIGVSNHNPLRRYYKTRNSLYVGLKYIKTQKSFFFHVLYNTFFYDPFIILLFENYKRLKILSICQGIKDFIMKKYGKRK